MCVSHKSEDVNVFNMLARINEAKTLAKYILCNLMVKKRNSKYQWNGDKCQYECKKSMKYKVCKENYSRNSSICASECNRECRVDEYLKKMYLYEKRCW